MELGDSKYLVRSGKPSAAPSGSAPGSIHGHKSPRSSCGSAAPDLSDSWIQDKDDLTSNSFPPIPRIVALGPWRGDCFHPNIFGAEKIAHEVDADAKRLGLKGRWSSIPAREHVLEIRDLKTRLGDCMLSVTRL
jgi:hypothetical protein